MAKILLEFLVLYVIVFILYFFLFVFKKTKYNKNKIPVEFYYIVNVYKINSKDINYKKFMYITTFINSFILVSTYLIIIYLVKGFVWQIICGIILVSLFIIIFYGLLGRYYQKRGKKNV